MRRRGQAAVIGAVFLAIIFSFAALFIIQLYSGQQEVYREALKTYMRSVEEGLPSVEVNYTYPVPGNVSRDLTLAVEEGSLNCTMSNLRYIDDTYCQLYSTGPAPHNAIRNGDFSLRSSYWTTAALSDGNVRWTFSNYNATVVTDSATWSNSSLSQVFELESDATVYYLSFNYSSKFAVLPSRGEGELYVFLDGQLVYKTAVSLLDNVVSSANITINKIIPAGSHRLEIRFNASYLVLTGGNYHNFSVDNVVLLAKGLGEGYKAALRLDANLLENTINLTTNIYLLSNTSTVMKVYAYEPSTNSYKLGGEYLMLPGVPSNISVASPSFILSFESSQAFEVYFDQVEIEYHLLNTSGLYITVENNGPGVFYLNGVWIRSPSNLKRINVSATITPLDHVKVSAPFPLSMNDVLEIRLVGATRVIKIGNIRIAPQASFYLNTSTLHIEVSPPGSGSTTPSPGDHVYIAGASVTVTASETSPAYVFSHWLLNGTLYSTNATVTVTVSGYVNLTAVFEPISTLYYLNVTVNDPSYGTTNPPPGVYGYPPGSSVDVTASPNTNHVLWKWLVDGASVPPSNPVTVTMDRNHTVVAVFEPWLEGWQYRRKITITERSGNTLNNYQVRIQLSSADFDFSKANPDGSDIRFTASDKLTLLNYWIERWDPASGTAVIWVKVPQIPASGTVDIYMYYGNPSATSLSDLASVMESLPAGDGTGYTIYYQEWVMPANNFQEIGTPQGWRADDRCWSYSPPFIFYYYSGSYASFYICSNGFIDMSSSYADWSSTEREFKGRKMVAPFWADLRTDRGGDIYIDASYSDEYGRGIYIRWKTRFYRNNGKQNLAAVLYDNGLIRFDYGTIYGSSTTDDTPVIGVSFGDNSHYTLSSYNGLQYPSNYNSVMFWPRKKASTEPSVSIGAEETLP